MEAQNNNSPGGYGSPWHHQEGHGKLHQQNPGNINIHELEKITLLFFSPPSQAGPLHQVKTLFASKVHGLDSDVERGNHLQLH